MVNKEWYLSLRKSKLTPPNYIFSIVWGILYISIIIL
jgi:tryptophan-rich sensory protein